MKVFSLICTLVFGVQFSFAQLPESAKKQISAFEEEMKEDSRSILFGLQPSDRLAADSIFTRKLVRALKTPNSFYYPFDSLITISKLYAPDSTFRIFTWNRIIHDNSIRQHGAIQMRTTDGSLKLFPLIDKSDIITNRWDTVANNHGWVGAVYYKIIKKDLNGQPVYTLLGFDENSIRSNIKMIDILQFKNGEPVFGAPIFSIADGQLVPKKINRYVMEYKKDAGPRLNYDADLDLIMMEHLVSESNEPHKKYTLIGDGDYEAFKWLNGKWTYINKVFHEVTPEGKPPMPNQILDEQGNIDESKVPGFEDAEVKENNRKGSKTKKKSKN